MIQGFLFFLFTIGTISCLIIYLWVYTENDETTLTIEIQNTNGSSNEAIVINAPAGGVDLYAKSDFIIDVSENITLTASSTIRLECDNFILNSRSGNNNGGEQNGGGISSDNLQLVSTIGDLTIESDYNDVNINASSSIFINATSGSIDLSSNSSISIDSSENITINNKNTDGRLQLYSSGNGTDAIHIFASSGGVSMDSVGAIKINATNTTGQTDGKLQLVSEDTMLIQSEKDATFTANGYDNVLTLRATGGGEDQAVNIESHGLGQEAITMNSAAGGVELSSYSKFKIINFGNNDISGAPIADGGIHIESSYNASDALRLYALSGGLDIDVDTDITMNSKSSDITLNAESGNVSLHSSTTEVDSILIQAHSGGITMSSVGAIKISANSNLAITSEQSSTYTANGYDSVLTLRATGGGESQGVDVVSQGTGSEAITVNAVAGGLELSSYSKLKIINFGNDACGNAIADGGILLESAYNTSDAIHLRALSGGIDIDVDSNISLNSTSNDITLNSENANINLSAQSNIVMDSCGNINLISDGIVTINCDQFNLNQRTNEQVADAQNLTARSGNITLLAQQGDVDINLEEDFLVDSSNGNIRLNARGATSGGSISLSSNANSQDSFTINTIGSEGGGGIDIRTQNFPTRYYKSDDANPSSDASGSIITEGGILVKKTVVSYGGFDNVSDRRLKTNIKQIRDAIPVIKRIRPVTFNWKKNLVGLEHGKSELGFIAQEVERAFPNYLVHNRGDDSYKTVDYTRFCPLLLAGIREQQTQIEIMTKQIDALQKTLKIKNKK